MQTIFLCFVEESGGIVFQDISDDLRVRNEVDSATRAFTNVTNTCFSPEGLVTVSTVGHIHCFLRTPQRFLHATNGAAIAFLSSYRQLTILNCQVLRPEKLMSLDFDPEVISLGKNHISFGLTNTVRIYSLDSAFNNGRGVENFIKVKYPVKVL